MAKQKSKTVILVVGIALLLIGGGILLTKPQAQDTLSPTGVEEAVAEITALEAVDFEAAAAERILGDPNAPIKISEHSSLTCGHCASFHKNTFKAFKAAWIDTGKAYLVFSDFPLNGPALHASMAARCVPEDRYFDFVQDLFETQDSWAGKTNYMSILKEKANGYGLNGAGFDTCLESDDLQKAILGRMRGAQAQWEISSTPSFVVNNTVTLSGAMAFEAFDLAIKNAVSAPAEKELEPTEE